MYLYNFFQCLIKPFKSGSMPKRVRKPHINIKNRRKFNTTTSIPQKKSKIESIFANSTSNLSTTINMSFNGKVEVLSTPIKSANDKKEYKVIRLPNGLIACLVSDPSNINNILNQEESDDETETETETETEEEESANEISDEEGDTRRLKCNETEEKLAAASLCVSVGSFSDPSSIPGLAHFLEHMVFMGSEKYQQENDFDAFLKKRGGSDNASTDCEMTTFYFECLEKYLEKALDIWSQFFIAPLMKKDSMTREREAIESEFQMALPSDTHRKEQMLSSFAKENSPVNKFMWGNLKTLRDNVGDDYLYEQVHAFRKRHYSANRMTLAIQARLPLDVLESYVVGMFSAIPNNNSPKDNFSNHDDNIFNNPMFNRIYYIKPVKDVYQVDLTFAMPSLLHLYKSKPHQYVSWLLGHEGKGSLLSYLKEKIWVHGIYCGNAESGMEHNSMYALFTVTLILTPDGINHIYEIIEAIFSYINLLKQVGPQERIYNEIKTIEDTSFRFKEEETASDFVEDLAQSMQYYPPEDYLRGSELYMEYNPEAIKMVLEKLNPKNVNIMILSSTIPENIKYDKLEPWFSVDYTDLDIPADCIEKWTNITPMECFSLPADNKFLATNFELLECPGDIPTYPEKLIDSDIVELWYKPDNKFQLPHAFIYYYFTNNYALDSALSSCMVDLFVNILLFQLTEEAYPAHVADLSYAISVHDYGILVKVNGYNDKLPHLLELIIEYIKKMPQTTTENLFNAVKDIQTRSYYNTFIKPSKLAKGIRLSALQNKCWHALAKYHAITKNVTCEDFIKFSNEFLKEMHIQGLIQGNISKEIALNTNDKIIKMLDFIPVPQEKIRKIQIHEIENDKICFRVKSFNKNDSNSIVTAYYQIGPGDLKTLVTLDTIMLLMEEPLFDILRTKEQLGYDVHCMLHDTYGILGYSITVNTQAKKFTTEHVDQRIDEFLLSLNKTIKKMPNKKIDEIKENLIKIKQVADVHLKDEVCRNWNEIVQQDFFFDRIPREIEAIQQLKNSDIKKWLEKFSLDEKYRRKLSIQVVGYSDVNCDVVSNNEIEKLSKDEIKLEFINNIGKNSSNGYTYITEFEEYKNKLILLPEHRIIA